MATQNPYYYCRTAAGKCKVHHSCQAAEAAQTWLTFFSFSTGSWCGEMKQWRNYSNWQTVAPLAICLNKENCWISLTFELFHLSFFGHTHTDVCIVPCTLVFMLPSADWPSGDRSEWHHVHSSSLLCDPQDKGSGWHYSYSQPQPRRPQWRFWH